MGQTVSLGACISGGSVVRVMNTAGVFESYEFPLVTAEVMLNHPDHLVVHCGHKPKDNKAGQSKINIMLPEQPLLPGEPYMLYPIPERHKATLAQSKSFSVLRRQLEAKGGEVSAAPEKKKGRRHALKLITTRLQLATLVASKLRHKAATAAEVVDVEQRREEEESFLEKSVVRKKKAPQPLEMPCYHWTPALSSIPESPLGFHSTPRTPIGLYKMDGISENTSFPGFFPCQTTTTTTSAPPQPTVPTNVPL